MLRQSEAVSDLMRVRELMAEAAPLLTSPALQAVEEQLMWTPQDRFRQPMTATILQQIHAADAFADVALQWLSSKEDDRADH